jgi:hypothetical protein
MSRHNRNPSQRPAHQQVATRPGSPGEASLDTERIPSPATDSQSQEDALAGDSDRYQAGPGITETDPLPGEATDVGVEEAALLVEDADVDGDGNEDDDPEEEDFGGFEDLNQRQTKKGIASGGATKTVRAEPVAPLVIQRSVADQEEYDMELVPIIPRITQQRVNIGGEWYNFIKGMEQFVPRAVADHLRSKGII